MIHTFDRQGIRFAIWTGHGRDPEVAYLDGRLMVIATSELRQTGWRLHGSGLSYNILGGERRGEIDAAVLHRIVHAAVGRDGRPFFDVDEPCDDRLSSDGFCGTAERQPRPGTPAEPEGFFVIGEGFAVQWVTWEDIGRVGVVRRAVYVDDRFLLEAGTGPDGAVRLWPARGLMPHGLELVTPLARETAEIEERVFRATGVARSGIPGPH